MVVENYIKKIFKINNDDAFNSLALELFSYQYNYNNIYKQYVDLIGVKASKVQSHLDIPFLPIEMFKTQEVICKGYNFSKIFKSSGTTNTKRSKHYIINEELYITSILNCFKIFFG